MERSGKAVLLLALYVFVASQEWAAADVSLRSVNLPVEEAKAETPVRKRRSINTFIDAAIQNSGIFLESPPPAIFLHPEPVVLGAITITCPDGMATVNSVCVPCPPGTKLLSSGYCDICPTGTYQESNRSSECLPCETSGRPGMTYCPECITSCDGLVDGNYQSCSGCGGYAACSNQELIEMPCAADLVWDNGLKQCDYTSTTCEDPPTTVVTTTTSGGGDPTCVSHCSGLVDGSYQLCDTCQHYAMCSSGNIYIMPCPAGLVWDDITKGCGWSSQTCSP